VIARLPQTRVEVTDPTGRHFVANVSLLAATCTYAEHLGYRLREVEGYDSPDGRGFCIVNRCVSAGQGLRRDPPLLNATVRASVSDQTSMAQHQRFRP
jgi:hypothetical protein